MKAYRGQRKCQHSPEGQWGVCGQPKSVHEELDHPFTQTPLRCEACGEPINIGDPYKWVAPRAHRATKGIKRNRHATCRGWKPSELTSSPHLATIYAAQEDAEEGLATISVNSLEDVDEAADSLREIAEQFADALQEAVESYAESADNIEDGFGHETYQSEELRGKSEDVASWADEAAAWSPDSFMGHDEWICEVCGDVEDEHDPEDGHDFEPDHSELDDWLEEQQGDLTDIIYNSPV